jgi:hypothetical protein
MLAERQRQALRADIREVRDPAGVTQTIFTATPISGEADM